MYFGQLIVQFLENLKTASQLKAETYNGQG
jgi:hypothetical protein